MLNRINDLIKTNLLAGNKVKANTYKLFKSELIKNEKSPIQRTELEVLKSYIKQLEKSLDAFKGRPEMVKTIEDELSLIKEFLPTPKVNEETIRNIALSIYEKKKITNQGLLIKETKQLSPEADGGTIARIVKEILSNVNA